MDAMRMPAARHITPTQVGVELLLLDLDGVIVDTLPVMRAAWTVVQTDLGIEVSFETYSRHLGRPFPDIMRMLAVQEVDEAAEVYDTASVKNAHLAKPFPGVEDALRAVDQAGCRLGIVTSKPLSRATPLLDRIGCHFSVVRTPITERGKPAPDMLLLALVDARTDPAKALYVGDMAVDEEAARRAGLRYAHAGWGYGSHVDPSTPVLSDPSALARLVATATAEGFA